jgi:ubiquitin carboxyl-terminal hydrolase L3
MTPHERAKLLEETNLFATAHEAAAAGGQSAMPTNLDTNYHFVAFVQAPDVLDFEKHRIVELDGRRSGPVDLGESNDLLTVGLSLQPLFPLTLRVGCCPTH